MSATGEARQLPPGACGFTLVEMLVVLAIAGLVGGLMFPAVDRAIGMAQFRSAQAEAAGAVAGARARAIRTGLPVTLRFAADGRSYAVGTDRPVEIAGAASVSSAPGSITFFADGSATGGAISIAGGRGAVRLLVADATGLIVASSDAS